MLSRLATSVVLASVIGLSAFGSRAEACEPSTSIQGFEVLPAEGSRVPRTTVIWLRSDAPLANGETVKDASAVKLFDERGKGVTLAVTSVRVSGEVPATLFVLKPMITLDANASYRVELNGAVLTRFSTSEEIDVQPPELPKATLDAAPVKTTCTPRLSVTLESRGDVNFLIPAATTGAAMLSSALAVSTVSALTMPGTDAMAVRVVAFDLSGNMAASADKLQTYVAADAVGCSSTVAGPGLGALALVAMLRRRRLSR
jgi:hypothetical protein